MGEEFAHVEIVFDARIGAVSAYILGRELSKAARVDHAELKISAMVAGGKEPLALTLTAVENVLTGETAGHSSVFSTLEPALRGVEKFDGTLASITVKGKEFRQVEFHCPAHKR